MVTEKLIKDISGLLGCQVADFNIPADQGFYLSYTGCSKEYTYYSLIWDGKGKGFAFTDLFLNQVKKAYSVLPIKETQNNRGNARIIESGEKRYSYHVEIDNTDVNDNITTGDSSNIQISKEFKIIVRG